jgi:hypothetical protein
MKPLQQATFNHPATPAFQPIIPASATSALIGELVHWNIKAKCKFNECNNIEKALKAKDTLVNAMRARPDTVMLITLGHRSQQANPQF